MRGPSGKNIESQVMWLIVNQKIRLDCLIKKDVVRALGGDDTLTRVGVSNKWQSLVYSYPKIKMQKIKTHPFLPEQLKKYTNFHFRSFN